MNHTSKSLALRDSALAILVGAVSGSDFGAEEMPADFGAEFAGDYGYEFGDEFGDDYGYDWGAEFAGPAPAPHPTAMRRPAAHPAVNPAAMAAWNQVKVRRAHSARRNALLEPNQHSDIKVERYGFSVNAALVLGTTSTINVNNNPDTTIRPQRITVNAPAPGFVTLTDIKVANVSVLVGGTSDAFQFNANGVGQSFDMPTLSPANRAAVVGSYSGYTPPGYVLGSAYTLCVSFTGPSKIIA